MRYSIGWLLVVIGWGLSGCQQKSAAPSSAPAEKQQAARSIPALAGNWTGDAKIVVNWIEQKTLPVQLQIAADGSVAGTVGDATLVEAKVRPGRNALERSLGWARDFRIHGKLQGDLIAAEKAHRDEIDIVFDRMDDTTLRGGLATSGWEMGPSDVMKITAGQMVLRPGGAGGGNDATAR